MKKKVSMETLARLVEAVMLEEKKKKASKKKDDAPSKSDDGSNGTVKDAQPKGFKQCPQHDMSKPLGDFNIYALQGASNMGPWTATPLTGDAPKKKSDVKEGRSAWDKFTLIEVDEKSAWSTMIDKK